MQEKWIEKIYAGFLGMDAGMRLGAPGRESLLDL